MSTIDRSGIIMKLMATPTLLVIYTTDLANQNTAPNVEIIGILASTPELLCEYCKDCASRGSSTSPGDVSGKPKPQWKCSNEGCKYHTTSMSSKQKLREHEEICKYSPEAIEGRKAECTCQYCKHIYGRPQECSNHMRVCPCNPSSEKGKKSFCRFCKMNLFSNGDAEVLERHVKHCRSNPDFDADRYDARIARRRARNEKRRNERYAKEYNSNSYGLEKIKREDEAVKVDKIYEETQNDEEHAPHLICKFCDEVSGCMAIDRWKHEYSECRKNPHVMEDGRLHTLLSDEEREELKVKYEVTEVFGTRHMLDEILKQRLERKYEAERLEYSKDKELRGRISSPTVCFDTLTDYDSQSSGIVDE
jgi:hypothetical protein